MQSQCIKINSPNNLSVAQYVYFILLFFVANEVKNRFKNLKDYYRQIKRDKKLKSGDGMTATEEGRPHLVWYQRKRKKTEWKYFKMLTWLDDPQQRSG